MLEKRERTPSLRNGIERSLPRISEIGLNWSVVGFALALGVVTGLACGIVPAIAALIGQANWWPSRLGAGRSATGRTQAQAS